MKKFLRFFTFLLLTALLVTVGCDDNTLTEQSVKSYKGVINDGAGSQASGVVVKAFKGSVVFDTDTADEEGNFVIGKLPEDVTGVKISFSHPIYGTEIDDLSSVKTTTGESLVKPMRYGDSCCGKIEISLYKLGTQDIISGAEVRVSKFQNQFKYLKTGADGKATFKKMCDGIYHIRISKAGFQVQEFQVPLIGNCDSAKPMIYMQPNVSDSCCDGKALITLTDSLTGLPLKNALVKLWKGGKVLGELRTDSLGKVLIRELCVGDYGLSFSAEKYNSAEMSLHINCHDSLNITKKLYKSCCNGIAFISVKDSLTNASVSNASLILKKGDTKVGALETQNGTFLIRELCEGTYRAIITVPNKKTIEYNFTIACGDSLNFVKYTYGVCCNGVAVVTVRDSLSNQLIKDATVKLSKAGKVIGELKTDVNGKVIIRDLCEGEYGVNILLGSKNYKEFGFYIKCNDTLFFEKKIYTPCCNGVANIIVKDSLTGQIIANATIKLMKANTVIGELKTDASGKATIKELCEGEYIVKYYADKYDYKTFSFAIHCNDTLNFEKKLYKACCNGKVFITFKDKATGNLLPGASAYFTAGGKTYSQDAPNGTVLFKELCEGSIVIIAKKSGYKSIDIPVTIHCNDSLTFLAELTKEVNADSCCKGIIKVLIKDSTGAILPGATVKLWKGSSLLTTLTTDVNGWVKFEHICPSTYQISVIKSTYKGVEFPVVAGCNDTIITDKRIGKITPDTCCTAVIRLICKDKNTAAFLQGASVKIYKNQALLTTLTSNANGVVEFTGLCAPATYVVKAEKTGYAMKEFTFTFNECKTIQETCQMQP